MFRPIRAALLFSSLLVVFWVLQSSKQASLELTVSRTQDFEITGDGSRSAWSKIEWTVLNKRSGAHDYVSRFKMLYSTTGLYFLMDGEDTKVTATMTEDFDDLWKEDVFEVFLWTDKRFPVYFEYEISPLGRELPIIVPNFDGKFLGWRPWNYEGQRKIQKKVRARSGELLPGASIAGWTAEFFIPYELLQPLANVPPKPGSRWRANFYRVDHDDGKSSAWDWARVGGSFHEYEKFGTILFGE